MRTSVYIGKEIFSIMSVLWDRATSGLREADISVFHKFSVTPRGGGNQFLLALCREWARRGLSIERNRVSSTTQACLFNSYNFDFRRLRWLVRKGCRKVHRVDGPLATYRGFDDGTDGLIQKINEELADRTILQSEYSRRAHEELGLRLVNPTVIPNAVDPLIFHARDRSPFATGGKVRLISVSWSDNINKGAAVYQSLDRMLDFNRYEYSFVGQIKVPLKNIRVISPLDSYGVAEKLRRHDIYITAGRNDPCSNSLIEALACGLPAVYLDSGGHREIVKGGGLSFKDVEEVPRLLGQIVDEHKTFQEEIHVNEIGEIAKRYLGVLGLNMSS